MPGRRTNQDVRANGAKLSGFETIKKKLDTMQVGFEELVEKVNKNNNAKTGTKEELTAFLNSFSTLNDELNKFIEQDNEHIKNFKVAFKKAVTEVNGLISEKRELWNKANADIILKKEEQKKAEREGNDAKAEGYKQDIEILRKQASEHLANYKIALKNRNDFYKEYHVIENRIRDDMTKSQNSARIIKREAESQMKSISKDFFGLISNAADPSKMTEIYNNLRIKAHKRVKEPEILDAFDDFLGATFKDGFSKDGPFRKAFIDIIQKGILNGISKNLNNIVGGGSMNMPFFSSVLPGFNSASLKDIIKERMENPAKFYREYGKDFAAGGTLMKEATSSSFQGKYKDFGISERDLAKAMGELNKQMADFSYKYTPAMREELKEVVVSLEKAGIASNISAKALSDLSRVFNVNSTTSSIYVRDLAALGKAMNINDKVVQDLTSNSGKLAHLNENTLKRSIVDLSIASNKLGIELGTLLGQVGNFQTFEGAASAAGELNIALGGQFIDALGLMKDSLDDPYKALTRLKSSFEQAGKSVDALDPAQIKYFASAYKLSEEEFRKFFRSTNQEMMQYSVDMKAKAESEKNFQTMMIKSRDVFTEVTNAFFSAFNQKSIEVLKDMVGIFGKFLNFVANIIDLIGPALTATIVAGFGFWSMLKTIQIALNGIGMMQAGRAALSVLAGNGTLSASAAAGTAAYSAGAGGLLSRFSSNATKIAFSAGGKSLIGGGLGGALVGGIIESMSDDPKWGRVVAEGIGGALGTFVGAFLGGGIPGGIAGGMVGSAGGAALYNLFNPVEDGIILSRPGQKPSVVPISSSDSVKLIAGKPGGPIEKTGSQDNGELASLLKELISKIDGISERPINVDLDGKRVSSALYELNRRSPYNK